jgi:hypothetical protein
MKKPLAFTDPSAPSGRRWPGIAFVSPLFLTVCPAAFTGDVAQLHVEVDQVNYGIVLKEKLETGQSDSLSDGPNAGPQDAALAALPKDLPPTKGYADQLASYASNEICLNWQASLVFLLAGELQ